MQLYAHTQDAAVMSSKLGLGNTQKDNSNPNKPNRFYQFQLPGLATSLTVTMGD